MDQFRSTDEEEENNTPDVIHSSCTQYVVEDLLGEGVFGQVATCRDLNTGTKVAIKFEDPEIAMHELSIMLRLDDKNNCNIIDVYEYFQWGRTGCLVLELLDKSLLDVLMEIQCLGMCEIRLIMRQLLVALQAVERAGIIHTGIIHTDIKLDNIMFVNQKEQPFRIKLIDFGLAFPASEVKPGMSCQPKHLKAPEVILGLPFTEAIDMWSAGLVMADMFLGSPLYPVTNEYDLLRLIIDTQGQPPTDLLNNGQHTQRFFTEEQESWRLKTPEEYQNSGQQVNAEARCVFRNLLELTEYYEVDNDEEHQDLCEFVDLLQKMLKVDPRERIKPSEALRHNFFTRQHLLNEPQSSQNCSQTGHTVSDSNISGLVDVSDPTRERAKTFLKRIQNFFSKVIRKIIRTVFRNMARAKKNIPSCSKPTCARAATTQTRDNTDSTSPGTREGMTQTFLNQIRHVIAKMFGITL